MEPKIKMGIKRAKERTRHLASFPQLNPNPVIEVDSFGQITFSNTAAGKILEGLGMGKENITLFLPADLDLIIGRLEKREESVLYREVVIKDRVLGETINLVPQFNVVRIYAYDITEHKRAEEALRESEERLKRAQEIAHLGSWELDLVNDRLSWSDEVYRIFGLRPQEFGATYEAFLEAVHPDDRAAVHEAYSASLREGRDTYEIEHRVVRKATGELRYVHEKCEHLRDETGRIIRSFGMVHDITERKRAEEDLLKLSEDMAARNIELELVNKELESFIYSISHDLRAPLRSIAGFVKIVVDDYAKLLDVQGQDYLARIHNGAEKMSRLIEDLLYLSKISRQEIQRNKVDMSKIASSLVWELREANPERSVEVDIKESLTALADRRLIEIVLANLLENAWKFTAKEENARIEFGTLERGDNPPLHLSSASRLWRPSQEGTIYYIRDNGAGFDPQYMEKMFSPFQRLHSDKEFEGTGIGLAIVERIIHRHGGRVWAEGDKGKGATIYFTMGQEN